MSWLPTPTRARTCDACSRAPQASSRSEPSAPRLTVGAVRGHGAVHRIPGWPTRAPCPASASLSAGVALEHRAPCRTAPARPSQVGAALARIEPAPARTSACVWLPSSRCPSRTHAAAHRRRHAACRGRYASPHSPDVPASDAPSVARTSPDRYRTSPVGPATLVRQRVNVALAHRFRLPHRRDACHRAPPLGGALLSGPALRRRPTATSRRHARHRDGLRRALPAEARRGVPQGAQRQLAGVRYSKIFPRTKVASAG